MSCCWTAGLLDNGIRAPCHRSLEQGCIGTGEGQRITGALAGMQGDHHEEIQRELGVELARDDEEDEEEHPGDDLQQQPRDPGSVGLPIPQVSRNQGGPG